MDKSTFKKFKLPTDILPGDITSGSIIDGAFTIYYQKVGKLYFGISVKGAAFGGAKSPIGMQAASISMAPVTDAMDRIASLLGLTVNTYYPSALPAFNSGSQTAWGLTSPGVEFYQYSAGWGGFASAGGDYVAIGVGFLAN